MGYFTNKKQYLLKEYVVNKKNIIDIAKEVGISYSTVQRGLEEHNIDTELGRRGRWKRSNKFISEMRQRLRGKKYKPKTKEIRDRYKEGAKKRLKKYPHKYSLKKNYKSKTGLKNAMKNVYGKSECFICNWKDHPEILQVHHKDMNHNNNTLKNCIWLCPNCHSYVHYKEGYGN